MVKRAAYTGWTNLPSRRQERRYKALLLLLLILLSFPLALLDGTARASSAAVRTIPLLLVHGLGSSPAVWGWPERSGDEGWGFFEALVAVGYRPGETLFAFDYREAAAGDYERLAERFGQEVERLARGSPTGQVDVLAHSMGGLIARYYVEALGGAGKVRNLILIATPNRGSFAANLLKRVAVLEEVLASPHPLAAGADARVLSAPFSGEVAYVARAATHYFADRFRSYLFEDLFLVPPTERAAPRSFFEWLRLRHPEEMEAAFDAAQIPPLGDREEGAFSGKVLTRSFFHLLALDAARHILQSELRPAGGRAVTGVEGRPRGWLEVLAAAWVDLRSRLGEMARDFVLGASRAFVGVEPFAPAVARLVTERAGEGLVGEADRVDAWAANLPLLRWNRAAEGARRARTGRYVSLIGVIPNLWRPVFPNVGANDGVVPFRSAYLPPGPLDEVHLFPGLVTVQHAGLLRSKRVQERVLELLSHGPSVNWRELPLHGRKGVDSVRGSGAARLSRPTVYGFRSVAEPMGEGRPIAVTVTVEGGPAVTWEAALLRIAAGRVRAVHPLHPAQPGDGEGGGLRWSGPGEGSGRDESRSVTLRTERPVVWRAGEEELLLSVRVAPGPERMTVERLEADRSFPFRYELAWERGRGAVREAVREGGETDPPDPEAGGAGPVTVEGPPPVLPGYVRDRVPSIEMVYRSKRTTHKEPKETRPARWVWDFGDGSRVADEADDEVETSVTHRFERAGTFRVVGESWGDDGRLLRRKEWEVEVAEGEERRFSLRSIVPPQPVLELLGPEEWVVGRPARYRLRLTVPPVPNLEKMWTFFDPGEQFDVTWRRPGRFVVSGAVTLRLQYRFEEGSVTVYNTYRVDRDVEVLATSVTD